MSDSTYIITLIAGIIMGVVSLVIIAGAVYAIAIWYPRQVDKRVAELKRSGKQGEATILRLPRSDMRGYGSSDAMYKLVSVGLEIRVPGVEPYEIDKVFTIPSGFVRELQVGKIVPVWIDPNNPRNTERIVIYIE